MDIMGLTLSTSTAVRPAMSTASLRARFSLASHLFGQLAQIFMAPKSERLFGNSSDWASQNGNGSRCAVFLHKTKRQPGHSFLCFAQFQMVGVSHRLSSAWRVVIVLSRAEKNCSLTAADEAIRSGGERPTRCGTFL